MINSWLKSIKSWFTGLFCKPKRYIYKYVEDIPDTLDDYTVYICDSPNSMWLASMKCPSGCGSRLNMNLLPSHRPCWKIDTHVDGSISFSPSLWKKDGCKSHFFLKHGEIKWVK